MALRLGDATVAFQNRPSVLGYGSIVGPLEGEGPYGEYFDEVGTDARFGEETFEQAESKLQKAALAYALARAGLKAKDVQAACAGDLLNQCIGSTFAMKEYAVPLIGLYGACSTMALSLFTGALSLESGGFDTVAAVTSSHFCSAERQYRFPLNYGSLRPSTAQWTVTGSGAMVLGKRSDGPHITAATIGKIIDLGVSDQNNMGAAMAPAAADTIVSFLRDTGRSPKDYDVILTGDLGSVGSRLLYHLCEEQGVNLLGVHRDGGCMIYEPSGQDVHAGGSGCGCSASLLCSYFAKMMEQKTIARLLYCATGALLSPTSVLQGKSIPAICHAVEFCAE